ncbi:MAG: L,D-transpeptidase [Acidobacteria bacterium]|nr:MAG: L,D-transpeptidase [Acidobacteriota bacterium]
MESKCRRLIQKWILAALVLTLAIPAFAQAPNAAAPERHQRVVLVSIPDRKLAVIEDGNVLAKFPVAVGAAATPSPMGDFEVVSRVSNPTYYRPGTVIASGKGNPLGTRWVGLSQKGYGIHGTNAPRSVGHAASHGCIRLHNRDMELLFSMLRTGDVVQIRGEGDEQVATVFGSADDATLASEQVAEQDGGQ